ncbi:MAG: RNA methyltransferase [Propionibacteriaceae bacterium]|jgi:TrmH family RNA methyltransferase|nr:RNA methyltransferase [Propionibacteriaceae bacterium]
MTQVPSAFSSPISGAKLRSVLALTRRKGRNEAGLFLAEGQQAVSEALAADAVEYLLVDEYAFDALPALLDSLSDRDAEPRDCPVFTVPTKDFARLSDTVTPQGIIAVCEQRYYRLTDVPDPRLVVICAQVRDPGNAGTIIRCASAFGADAVIFTQGSVEAENPKTVRSSVGTIFHLPIIQGVPLEDAVAWAQASGAQVLAADAAGVPLGELATTGGLSRPTAWLFGNEAWGFAPETLALADRTVAIEMPGSAESLNVATAAAVLLYQSALAR